MVLGLLSIPERMLREDRQNAATIMQKVQRGRSTRSQSPECHRLSVPERMHLQDQQHAAMIMQKVQRGKSTRIKLGVPALSIPEQSCQHKDEPCMPRPSVPERMHLEDRQNAATIMQKVHRGRSTRSQSPKRGRLSVPERMHLEDRQNAAMIMQKVQRGKSTRIKIGVPALSIPDRRTPSISRWTERILSDQSGDVPRLSIPERMLLEDQNHAALILQKVQRGNAARATMKRKLIEAPLLATRGGSSTGRASASGAAAAAEFTATAAAKTATATAAAAAAAAAAATLPRGEQPAEKAGESPLGFLPRWAARWFLPEPASPPPASPAKPQAAATNPFLSSTLAASQSPHATPRGSRGAAAATPRSSRTPRASSASTSAAQPPLSPQRSARGPQSPHRTARASSFHPSSLVHGSSCSSAPPLSTPLSTSARSRSKGGTPKGGTPRSSCSARGGGACSGGACSGAAGSSSMASARSVASSSGSTPRLPRAPYSTPHTTPYGTPYGTPRAHRSASCESPSRTPRTPRTPRSSSHDHGATPRGTPRANARGHGGGARETGGLWELRTDRRRGIRRCVELPPPPPPRAPRHVTLIPKLSREGGFAVGIADFTPSTRKYAMEVEQRLVRARAWDRNVQVSSDNLASAFGSTVDEANGIECVAFPLISPHLLYMTFALTHLLACSHSKLPTHHTLPPSPAHSPAISPVQVCGL